jgi:hypothetical protein
MELPVVQTASSSAHVLACFWLSCQIRFPEPMSRHQVHRGDEGTHSDHHARNPHRIGRDDREGRSLSSQGPGPRHSGATCVTRVSQNASKH